MVDPRWRRVLTVTPYTVLGILIVYTLIAQWGQWSRVAPTLGLCLAFGAWIVVMRQLPFPWRDRPAAIAVFLTVLIVLNFVLVLRDGYFGFLTIASFMFSYSLARWPGELIPVAATATVAGIAQSSGYIGQAGWAVAAVAVIALNVVAMCGLGWGVALAQAQQRLGATELERSRMSREIHDTLAQGFTGIITQLQAADQAQDEAARRRHKEAALALARDGLAEARRSVNALRPAPLDSAGLPEALRNVARMWSARTGILVQVTTSGDAGALPTDVEVALLRTAQEALANIEKHAHAHRVTLVLRSDARGMLLEVRDDGRGFDVRERVERPRDGEHGGFGLVAMRERIESIAGEFTVESRPGRGTAVRARVTAARA
ncbi:sensor histidine kinase [Humibacter sp.]|uniref:sensor histidine kinase n=1 Tax=Humibacter sp. TaxID=1940291 RepID=UPI002D0A6F36|nr:sensor histidine kinase [Humibacter sp.]HVX08737.1 sensor histidine kinase [Humibacter sp.]